MKKILLSLFSLIFFFALVGNARAISFVQVNSATPQTPQTSVTVTYISAQVAGDLNIIVVGWNDSAAVVNTVTDTKGNVYQLAVGPTVQAGVASQSIYFAKNIAGAAANGNTVTVKFNVAAAYPDIRILEYSGIDTTSPVDVTASATGNSSTSNSGSVTTKNANDLIFGANLVQTSTQSAGTGLTSRIITAPNGDIAEDRIVSAVGSYSATAPLTSAGPWIMQMVAFKAQISGPAPSVSSVVPNSGPTTGGTAVTITGANFASGATVNLGETAATNVIVASGTSISATTPAHAAGAVNVVVTNPDGQSGTLTNGFTYTVPPAPTVTINQASGQADPTNASPINFTVIFSASVTGFATGDVTISGTASGTKTATVSGSGSTYNVAVSGMTLSGTVIATIAAGVAQDAAGNGNTISTSTDNSVTYQTAAPPQGLVAAYSFNENVGLTVTDASGNGNTGTISGATWTTSGRYGNALLFNGTNAWVIISDSQLLHLTTGMTLEAWVNPISIPPAGCSPAATCSWMDVIHKDSDRYYIEASSHVNGQPEAGGIFTSGKHIVFAPSALPLNTWTHLALTYDSAMIRFYVNGLQVASSPETTPITTSNNPLFIGGDQTMGQYFNGVIDEIRVYNTALSQAQIQADMNTPIGGTQPPSDTTPPQVAITFPLNNAQVNDIITIIADAYDNVGIAGVQFLVDNVNVGAEDTNPPYGFSWDTRTVTNGAHILTARARDASGNTAFSAPVTVNVANANFFQNEILATGFDLPTSIKFLPDGRMLVVELGGAIKAVPPPYTQPDPTLFLQLTNVGSAGVQQGVYEIALDPDFVNNHFYYIFYTVGSPNRDRLSRLTADASLTGTVPGSEFILYEDPQNANAEHHGGAINFGNDGKIYFTTGEHFNPGESQLLSSPRGKIHRINKDGTAPTDNPFYDGTGPNWDSIWALGLRNPYRAYYDAPTGRLFIGDVGGNDNSVANKEEVNSGVAGANYGWPNSEGSCSAPCTSPIYSYSHNGRDACITGGLVYHGTQFPISYQGNYFFADYTQNWIRRLTFDANGNVNGVFNFEPVDGSVDGPYGDIVYLTEGPDGALYYVDLGYSDVGGTFGVSKIRRIRYIQSNQAPIAVAAAIPTSGPTPLTVDFSSAGSLDPEGQPITYLWAFGDGATSTTANPVYQYTRSGQYTVRLTVSDGVNSTISPPLFIDVGNKPVATILSPPDGSFFIAGDMISFSGDATDVDSCILPASAFTWNIDFLHEGHVHPGIPITGVTSGSFEIPTSGHDFSGNTRYRIQLTVTDSDGLQDTQSVLVYPEKVNLTFDSSPTGLTLRLDGIALATPFVHGALVNFTHTIEAPNQTQGQSTYTFDSWSDGGAQSHGIVVPTTNQNYLATFGATGPQSLMLAYSFNEGIGTTVADASGNGNFGTINGATWTTSGRFGSAIAFNGTNAFVLVNDSPSLDLFNGMTLEAWVYPFVSLSSWVDIVYKDMDRYYLEASSGQNTPAAGGTFAAGNQNIYALSPLPTNTWTHLAATFDSAVLQLYVNGILVASQPQATSLTTSTNALYIGGDSTWGQYFNGRIDEVRIYNRALSPAEIQIDMNTPIP